MAGTKTSALSALTALDDADLLPMVDVSDTTQAPTGTTKKMTAADVADYTARAIQPFVDATWYGVVADGVTNDTASLTAALTAAGSNSVVQLPGNGTLVVTDVITVAGDNVTIRGGSTTIVDASGVVTADSVFHLTGSGIHLADITIECGDTADFGVKIWGDDCTLSNVTVVESGFHGFYGLSANNLSFINCKAVDCGMTGVPAWANAAGYYMETSERLSFDHCSATGSLQHGYYLYGNTASELTMVGCQSHNNTSQGFSIRYTNATITGCCATGNGDSGLAVIDVNSDDIAITGCVLSGNGGSSGELVCLNVNNVAISGCIIKGSGTITSALRLIDSNQITITGNNIANTGTANQVIYATGTCDLVTVTGNFIQGQATSNVVTVVNTVNMHLAGNTIKTGAFGIRNFGTGVVTEVGNLFVSVTTQTSATLQHNNTRLGFYGAAPVTKAASPGVAAGTDAAVINAIITALRNLGLVT